MSEIICKKVVCKKDLCKEGNLQIDRRKQENISQLIAQVLADVRALKKSAVDYAHPEVRVTSSDPTLYGCNYFNCCGRILDSTITPKPAHPSPKRHLRTDDAQCTLHRAIAAARGRAKNPGPPPPHPIAPANPATMSASIPSKSTTSGIAPLTPPCLCAGTPRSAGSAMTLIDCMRGLPTAFLARSVRRRHAHSGDYPKAPDVKERA